MQQRLLYLWAPAGAALPPRPLLPAAPRRASSAAPAPPAARRVLRSATWGRPAACAATATEARQRQPVVGG
jgi:hypothetical protein